MEIESWGGGDFKVVFSRAEYERLLRYATEHALTESEAFEKIVQAGLDEVVV